MTPTLADLQALIKPDLVHAIDLETINGTDVTDKDCKVLGIGLANAHDVWYMALNNIPREIVKSIWREVCKLQLIAHNALFDAPFIARESGEQPNFIGCSLVLFKLLATEGYAGQSWSLEAAMQAILGISVTNKDDLAELLRRHKLPKARMGELADLEPEAFGRYCAQDADAALQIWWRLQSAINDNPDLEPIRHWHNVYFMNQLWLLAEQQTRGIMINVPELRSYQQQLQARMVQAQADFEQQESVRAVIKEYNQQLVDQHKLKEPPQLTKTGKVSKRWEQWQLKLGELTTTTHFNINSGHQLKWLFYDKLGFKPKRFSASGQPQLDAKLLPSLGAPGRLLAVYRKLTKEESYVEACRQKLRRDIIHPQFRLHGTVTGRLGGSGGLNLQQLPKSAGYLKCWQARPGYSLVQCDYSALEPVVLTEASRDPSLWKIYGPGMPPNDIYLFVGAHIPAFAPKIRRWYDPDSPTAEGIKLAKKHCKHERSICKTVHLAKQYGAGANKIHSTLVEAGINITVGEVAAISNEWNKLFVGIKQFGDKLTAEWYENKGYIFNGMGRPLAIDADYLKDIVNRYCQSTGHDILLLNLAIINDMRKERGIPMYPWICDFHDEFIFEAPRGEVPRVLTVYTESIKILNDLLQFDIPIKGDPQVAQTLAEIKVEE